MKVLIIINPVSGGGQGLIRGEELYAAIRDRGLDAEKYITARAGDARDAAGQAGFECVAVVGGDGTVNEAANGLNNGETRLAILPLGTANVVSRELNTPREPGALADLIARGASRRIDAGRCEGKRFLLGVGAGLDAAVVEEVHRTRGRRLSYAGYIRPVIRVLWRYAFPTMRVEVDGATLCDDAQYAVVGNCRFSAGVFALTPLARLDDGLLDVCAFRELNVLRLARLALASGRPGFAARKDIQYRQGRHVVLTPNNAGRIPYQVDGDPGGVAPVTATLESSALHVVAPEQGK